MRVARKLLRVSYDHDELREKSDVGPTGDSDSGIIPMGEGRSGDASFEASLLEREELVILRSLQFRTERGSPEQLGRQNDQTFPELAHDAFTRFVEPDSDSDAEAGQTLGRRVPDRVAI